MRANAASGPVAIGKFASDAEYLRARGDAAAETFDEWLSEGFDRAHERFGSAWKPMFQMGIPHGVLWRGPGHDPSWFCGVVAPSQDSIGRQYPLAVGVSLSGAMLQCGLQAAPLAVGALLDAAYAVVSEARAGSLTRGGLEEGLRSLPLPDGDALSSAAMQYADWSQSTPPDMAWGRVLRGGVSAAQRAVAVLRTARDRPGLVARLPIGDSPAGATSLWIDVLLRLWGAEALSSVFWALYDGALLVTGGAPDPRVVGCLWMRDATTDGMVDLTDLREMPASRAGPAPSSMHVFLHELVS